MSSLTLPSFRCIAKLPELFEKHGIKLVGCWVAGSEHTSWTVVEAPSIEAFQNFGYEQEVYATSEYDTNEIKHVMTTEEELKLMPELK